MNKFIITTFALLTMTGCAGYYSHFYPHERSQEEFTFDGEPRSFDLADNNNEEDVGSQEIISFDQ